MKDGTSWAALALEAYMAQVREAVANALADLDRAACKQKATQEVGSGLTSNG